MKSLIQDALKYARYGQGYGVEKEVNGAKILVMGTGGAGNNTIDKLVSMGIKGAECIAVNTDRQHLDFVRSDRKILIGGEVTRGLGAGGYPELGAAAAEESRESLREVLSGADLVFIAAGMGGGTGTGSAPVIAEIAKESDTIVVGVVTMPFKIEKGRIGKARLGLKNLQEHADTVVVIDNNRLLDIAPHLPIRKAFSIVDEVLANMVKGITETISLPSLINLDYADVKSIMSSGGVALVGLGEAGGSPGTPENNEKQSIFGGGRSEDVNRKKLNRVDEAVRNALNSPLLDIDYEGATGALIHIVGGEDLTLEEANRVGDMITSKMDPDAQVIWGARISRKMSGLLRVMLILTGVRSPQLLGRCDDESDIGQSTWDRNALVPRGLTSRFNIADRDIGNLGLDRMDT
ncbi:MAG: cell division protein FtsZ [Promethearchaeota archaeon]